MSTSVDDSIFYMVVHRALPGLLPASNGQYTENIVNKNLLDDLLSSLNNPKSFWNKFKQLSNSRQQTQNSITKGRWRIIGAIRYKFSL